MLCGVGSGSVERVRQRQRDGCRFEAGSGRDTDSDNVCDAWAYDQKRPF